MLESEEMKQYRTQTEIRLIEVFECGCGMFDPEVVNEWTQQQPVSFRLQFETQSTVFAAIEGAFQAADDGSAHELQLCSLWLLLIKVRSTLCCLLTRAPHRLDGEHLNTYVNYSSILGHGTLWLRTYAKQETYVKLSWLAESPKALTNCLRR